MNDLRKSLDEAPMSGFQWTAIAVCIFLNMIDGFDVLVMAFTAAPVSAEWKLTGSQLGFLFSAGLIGMAIGSLAIAPLADRVGRRPVILGCLFLCGVSMLASAATRSHVELALTRLVTGCGIGGILACSNVIASEYSSLRWRSLSVSLMSTGYALGATIGGSIAIWLIGHHGWRSVFTFGGIVTLLAVPAVLWRLPESLGFLLLQRSDAALTRINALAGQLGLPPLDRMPPRADAAVATTGRPGPRALVAPHLLRATTLIWVSYFLVFFGFYFVMSWTPKLLVAAGLSTQQGVTSGVLLSVGGIFGSLVFGLLSARFRVNRVLAVFMVITAALLSAFVAQTVEASTAFWLSFFIGVFVNSCVAGVNAIAPLVYDASLRATGVGWGIGVGRLGAIVSPLVAGALIDGGWRPLQLYVWFGLSFVVAAAVVLLHRIQAPVGSPAARFGVMSVKH